MSNSQGITEKYFKSVEKYTDDTNTSSSSSSSSSKENNSQSGQLISTKNTKNTKNIRAKKTNSRLEPVKKVKKVTININDELLEERKNVVFDYKNRFLEAFYAEDDLIVKVKF